MSRLSDDEKRYFTDQISMLKGEKERLTKCVEDLQEENEALRKQNPKVQISDGDVWLHFPYASLSIEGICKFGMPGPIVRRNLRKWRDALLTHKG